MNPGGCAAVRAIQAELGAQAWAGALPQVGLSSTQAGSPRHCRAISSDLVFTRSLDAAQHNTAHTAFAPG